MDMNVHISVFLMHAFLRDEKVQGKRVYVCVDVKYLKSVRSGPEGSEYDTENCMNKIHVSAAFTLHTQALQMLQQDEL